MDRGSSVHLQSQLLVFGKPPAFSDMQSLRDEVVAGLTFQLGNDTTVEGEIRGADTVGFNFMSETGLDDLECKMVEGVVWSVLDRRAGATGSLELKQLVTISGPAPSPF